MFGHFSTLCDKGLINVPSFALNMAKGINKDTRENLSGVVHISPCDFE